MQKKNNNSNHHKKMANRGKMAAIAGLTLTTGMILSEMAPEIVYASTLPLEEINQTTKIKNNNLKKNVITDKLSEQSHVSKKIHSNLHIQLKLYQLRKLDGI
ncbi:hypothetical protein [Companilactobacillus sp.]|uniref:hypothetical protein n=1 Tax=Companilactobacillus sp. TaxID=2767905 RepID=UPI00263588DE|nr:hypothetical protein [Companilactobacillus sp.]